MIRFMIILLSMTLSLALLQGMTGDPLTAQDSASFEEPEPVLPVVSSFPTELTVDGLISLARGNYSLQMGAFSRREYADNLSEKLREMLGINVDVIEESGLFKVFINRELIGSAPCLYIPVSFPAPVPAKTKSPETESPETEAPESEIPETEAVQTDTVAPAPEATVAPDTVLTGPDNVVAGSETIAVDEAQTNEVPPRATLTKRTLSNFFSLRGNSPWLEKYNYFGKSVALVNALIFIILASFVTMVILLITILLNRRRMEKEARLRQYLLEQYQSLIIDYLFGNAKSDAFRSIASDNYRRQVLVDQMIDVSVNLKGDSEAKLTRLYMELELDRDSIRRAHSRKWHHRIKGFRELAFMGIREANDEMYKSLNSRNEILRMEAQIALVRLSDKEHFEFLSKLERPFSLWEQITLHDLILQHNIPVPEFKKWLGSSNPTVVMFALRMIREFKQRDAEPEVKIALLHRDNRVSKLAVEVCGDLDLRGTLDTMKRMYKFQDYNGCLEIVKSMGKMPELAMMGFLKLVLDKEDDVQLQIEAVKAIENMGEEGVKALVKIMKSEYKNYNIIVRHVLDRRIY
ncbi:MAG TPA: SPOR domain-containing protein [Bacteroidales bacterium]|nr:SPOR domain-containing protein [Bacteroidales bacterium]